MPVIAAATAASAYAASPCSRTYGYKLRWGTTPYSHDQAASTDTSLTTGGGFASVTPLTVGGATIYVVPSSVRSGNTTFDSNRNLSVPTTGGATPSVIRPSRAWADSTPRSVRTAPTARNEA